MKKNNKIKLITPSDDELLKYYRMGWNQRADNKKRKKFNNELIQNAYDVGWLDFILGDDIRELDYQTDEERLKNIKNKNN